MNSNKMGDFIASQRKRLGYTQKDLAAKLGVTDKAVSKWERGLSYPDITLVPKLAETLKTSVVELMEGEAEGAQSISLAKASDSVQFALSYVKKVSASTLKWAYYITLALSIIGIGVCLICNVAIPHDVFWSLYVIGGIAILLSIVTPLLMFEKLPWETRALYALGFAAVLTAPYLFLIQWLSGTNTWALVLGLPILALSAALLFISIKTEKWLKTQPLTWIALLIVLGGVLSVIIQVLVENYMRMMQLPYELGWYNWVGPISTIALGVLLYAIDKVRKGSRS